MSRLSPQRMAQQLVGLIESQQPDRLYLKKVFAYVREALDLKGPLPRTRPLPVLLSEDELTRFYETVCRAANRTHVVLIKLLLVTGLRNAELANLMLDDVDLQALTLRVHQGKGGKDRLVPLPPALRGELLQYVQAQRERGVRYLFETNRRDKFTTRWVRAIVHEYAVQARIDKRVYPHLFRHQLLTHLTREGLLDAKLQLISGHQDRQSLAIYQELSLADVVGDYRQAMKLFPVQ